MDEETKKSELAGSKFRDSKVDIKEVFSEKTDLQSKADDLSTFSKCLGPRARAPPSI